jgi:hypothetical protein
VPPDFGGPGDEAVEPVLELWETDSTAAGGGSPGAAVEGVSKVVVASGAVEALGAFAVEEEEDEDGEDESACAGCCCCCCWTRAVTCWARSWAAAARAWRSAIWAVFSACS